MNTFSVLRDRNDRSHLRNVRLRHDAPRASAAREPHGRDFRTRILNFLRCFGTKIKSLLFIHLANCALGVFGVLVGDKGVEGRVGGHPEVDDFPIFPEECGLQVRENNNSRREITKKPNHLLISTPLRGMPNMFIP